MSILVKIVCSPRWEPSVIALNAADRKRRGHGEYVICLAHIAECRWERCGPVLLRKAQRSRARNHLLKESAAMTQAVHVLTLCAFSLPCEPTALATRDRSGGRH
jgi:hypothetical protein